MNKTTTLFSKGDCEFDRARLEIGIKTMFSGNRRVCVWKASPDGKTLRRDICYYNLHTGSVVLSTSTENYPEINFEEEMKLFAEDPESYDSLFAEDRDVDLEKLSNLIFN